MTSAERSTKLICLMSTAVQLAHWTLRACFRSARYPPPPSVVVQYCELSISPHIKTMYRSVSSLLSVWLRVWAHARGAWPVEKRVCDCSFEDLRLNGPTALQWGKLRRAVFRCQETCLCPSRAHEYERSVHVSKVCPDFTSSFTSRSRFSYLSTMLDRLLSHVAA